MADGVSRGTASPEAPTTAAASTPEAGKSMFAKFVDYRTSYSAPDAVLSRKKISAAVILAAGLGVFFRKQIGPFVQSLPAMLRTGK